MSWCTSPEKTRQTPSTTLNYLSRHSLPETGDESTEKIIRWTVNTEHHVVITRSDEKTSEEDREGGLGEAQARQIPGAIPSRDARVVNRRRTNFERTAHSATSNPKEESSQARTRPWTFGQDQEQTAIERKIMVPFDNQYD